MKLEQAAKGLGDGSLSLEDGFNEAGNRDSDDFGMDSTTNPGESSSDEHDEVQEVHKTTQGEKRRVHVWRAIATLVLLMTAVAVTLTMHKLLKDEEHSNFETAVSFSA